MTTTVAASYLPEMRERPVRLVLEGGGDHPTPWSAIDLGSVTELCDAQVDDRLHGGNPAQVGAPVKPRCHAKRLPLRRVRISFVPHRTTLPCTGAISSVRFVRVT